MLIISIFSFSHNVVLHFPIQISIFLVTFILSSANAFRLDLCRFFVVGKELTLYQTILTFNPLPDDKILDRSKLKQSADDDFKFDESSRKFSERVENTFGQGEIAILRAISPFSTVFSRGMFPGGVKRCHCVGMG